MRGLLQDLHYAVRSIRSRSGASLVIILTLTLGIGANVAIFTIVDALLLEPLAVPEADRIVLLWSTSGTEHGVSSFLNIQDWGEQSDALRDVAAFKTYGFTYRGNQPATRMDGALVSSSFFEIAGIRPEIGRGFTPEDEKPESERVVIVSNRFWRNQLGSDRSAVGRTLQLGGSPFTVVGVLPPDFRFPFLVNDADIWSTIALEGPNLEERGARVLHAVARLDDGVDLEEAQSSLDVIARRLARQYPDRNEGVGVAVVPIHEELSGSLSRILWMLFGASVLVLLIACANVASIQVANLRGRERELSLRSALGASRWRVVRQLLVESLLLSLAGGAAALLVVNLTMRALPVLVSQMPDYNEVQTDGTVLVFCLAVSILTTVLSTILPIVNASRLEAFESLKSGSRAVQGSFRGTRGLPIVAEVALSLGLLVAAGVLGAGMIRLISIDPGFRPENIITARLSLPRGDYPEKERRVEFVANAVDGLARVPGVESAAFATPAPFSGNSITSTFRIIGQPEPPPGHEIGAEVIGVTPDYFRTMNIGLLEGRLFDDHDDMNAPGALIINETAARRFWPAGESPIGNRIDALGVYVDDDEPSEWTIVGVVSDVKLNELTEESSPQIYVPHRQQSWRWGYFVVRSAANHGDVVPAMRNVVGRLDPNVPLYRIETLDSRIARSVSDVRLQVMLVAAFSILGLVLAAIGLYGLISWEIEQTRREIGVRVALGAQRGHVLGMVLQRGMTRTIVGIAFGLAIALASSRVLSTFAFEVSATSPLIYSGAVGTLVVTAFLACVVPARRALGIDPATALREE